MRHDKYRIKPSLQLQQRLLDICMKMAGCAAQAFLLIPFVLTSCSKKAVTFSAADRRSADSIVHSVHGIDSLAVLQKRLESAGDRLGSIVALREWGKTLRNESRLEEALTIHSEALREAEALGDTLEWVQALNNIGTDYRRMGVLDAAQEYHYKAWTLSEECTDTTFAAKKNRVVSLNGLGNVYLTLGNYERADSALRMALAGERQLHSVLGQAINYANLGSIFEHRGLNDSAWVYYRYSMALNTEAGNNLGISLCHIYFGSLYEKAHQYDKAIREYENAYQLMKASKDEWHALNSLIALAGIYQATGNRAKMTDYLDRARQVAENIDSPEHLAKIYTLYYKYYKQQGDCRGALTAYEQATAMQDSVLNIEKVNRIQNTSLNIERKKQERERGEMQLRLKQEQATKYTGLVFFVLVVILLLSLIGMLLYSQRIRRRSHLALIRLASMRESFFTNITHEFRTPLTVILGLSRDLQSSATAEVRDKALTIERQGNGLLTLINQLLDITKVKSALGRADWRNGNIIVQLMMIVESYRDYARSHRIELQFLDKGAVEMDFVPDYVNKVMNNLLSNAFKFTSEYGKVSVATWREDDRLRIDVSDTGEGMDAETLQHFFEPFYQGESDSQNIGTGVGLALVKQIIDAVEGTITVESVRGSGTVFHISVPIRNCIERKMDGTATRVAPLLPKDEPQLADSEGDEDRCRLLVIEDNREIAAYIGAQFVDRYAVSYATNGQEGWEKTFNLVPDLIITDLMMPGMDGLELCRKVRGNEVTDHIPIIVVTAKITEEERIRGLKAGADSYLSKPFSTDELRIRVEQLLDRQRRLRDKFGKGLENDAEQKTLITDAERRFLSKTVNFIYKLMDKRKLDVNTLAAELCMSPRQFHRKLVAITGDAPSSYILKIKMQRACHLLETKPAMTIEEVAYRCGFEHAPNFYSAFKKMFGLTPMDYRRGVGR